MVLRRIRQRSPGGRPAATASASRSDGRDFDVVYVSDLRFPGGTSTSLAHEIRAAARAGYSIGLLPLAATSVRTDRPMHPELRALVDGGDATLIPPGAVVRAQLAVVKHPTVLAHSLGGRLPIEVDRVAVIVGQTPREPDGTQHYELSAVDAATTEALGHRPTWWPVSPVMRARLLAEPDAASIDLADVDWVEVIDPAQWAADRGDREINREMSGDRRVVIGRHSRPDAAKWPATNEELLAAYPDDPVVEVRVLGGIDGIAERLGSPPANWTVLPFGSVHPREFLAGVDLYVYFHDPAMVEAFGRATLEALASGAVCVVSDEHRDLFGEACVYATPAEVRGVVDRLRTDPTWRHRQVELGQAAVRDRFSYAVHVERLAALVGPPGGTAGRGRWAPSGWAPLPPAMAAQVPVVAVTCLGASERRAEQVVRAVAAQRAYAAGFRPVVIGTVRAPAAADELGVPFEVITARANFSGADEMWPEYAQRRLRVILREYAATGVTVADLDHPDAWISLRMRPANP